MSFEGRGRTGALSPLRGGEMRRAALRAARRRTPREKPEQRPSGWTPLAVALCDQANFSRREVSPGLDGHARVWYTVVGGVRGDAPCYDRDPDRSLAAGRARRWRVNFVVKAEPFSAKRSHSDASSLTARCCGGGSGKSPRFCRRGARAYGSPTDANRRCSARDHAGLQSRPTETVLSTVGDAVSGPL